MRQGENSRTEARRADGVLVKVLVTGSCSTDLAVCDSSARMPEPTILCHEGAGIVEPVGSSIAKVRPGDPVVISFAPCGACASCLVREPAYYRSTQSLNFGGMQADGSSALIREGVRVHGHFLCQSSEYRCELQSALRR